MVVNEHRRGRGKYRGLAGDKYGTPAHEREAMIRIRLEERIFAQVDRVASEIGYLQPLMPCVSSVWVVHNFGDFNLS